MNTLSTSGTKAVSSIELVKIINEVRKAEGQSDLRHDNFMTKIESHPSIDSPKFLGQYKDSTGRTLKCYHLPKREAELMVMSESLSVQAKVYDRMTELELSVPKQRTARLPSSERESISMFKHALSMTKLLGLTGNQAILSADKASIKTTGISALALVGHTHLIADNRGLTFTPTELGKDRNISAQSMNKLLASSGLQTANASSWEPTALGLQHCEWLDTGKKNSSGTPVKQLKWFASACDHLILSNVA